MYALVWTQPSNSLQLAWSRDTAAFAARISDCTRAAVVTSERKAAAIPPSTHTACFGAAETIDGFDGFTRALRGFGRCRDRFTRCRHRRSWYRGRWGSWATLEHKSSSIACCRVISFIVSVKGEHAHFDRGRTRAAESGKGVHTGPVVVSDNPPRRDVSSVLLAPDDLVLHKLDRPVFVRATDRPTLRTCVWVVGGRSS